MARGVCGATVRETSNTEAEVFGLRRARPPNPVRRFAGWAAPRRQGFGWSHRKGRARSSAPQGASLGGFGWESGSQLRALHFAPGSPLPLGRFAHAGRYVGFGLVKGRCQACRQQPCSQAVESSVDCPTREPVGVFCPSTPERLLPLSRTGEPRKTILGSDRGGWLSCHFLRF